MWYRKTNRVFCTRDVVWLNKMYYTKENADGVLKMKVLEVDELEEQLINPQEVAANPIEDNELEVDTQEGNTLDENMPYGATRSGTRFRDIAASNIAHHPVKWSNAEMNYMCYGYD
jgi:hypothetical protein